MKQVKAIIQPQRLEDVELRLKEIADLPGLVVTRVEAFGQAGEGASRHRALTRMVEIQTVVNDNMVRAVIDAICIAAHTGHAGDGKIFVANIENVIRIRTGEEGEAAIDISAGRAGIDVKR